MESEECFWLTACFNHPFLVFEGSVRIISFGRESLLEKLPSSLDRGTSMTAVTGCHDRQEVVVLYPSSWIQVLHSMVKNSLGVPEAKALCQDCRFLVLKTRNLLEARNYGAQMYEVEFMLV